MASEMQNVYNMLQITNSTIVPKEQ